MSKPIVDVRARQPTSVISIQVANKGKDGYTPQKYVDYWTEDDQAEMKEYVNDQSKIAVSDYLRENPITPSITINGNPPDENGNFNIDSQGVSQDNVVEF